MKKMIKDTKGITLISLVVTLIILILLAGITISLVLGPNGIIAKAQYAKTQSEIGSEKEQLSMAVTEATLDNNGQQPTLEQIKNKIVEKGITTADNIKVGTDRLQVTTPKGHTYTIDINGDIEYVGEGAVTVPDLTDATVAFTYTPSTWTNGNVQVGITTTVKGFSLQYSTDGSTWSNYSSQITASSNETIYARLWDGINYGGVATGNVTNIDRTNPTLTLSTTNTSNSITITATGADSESGIAGYKYSKDNGNTWTDTTTNNTYTYTGLTQGQAYQIIVQVFDKAGNTVSKNTVVTTGAVTGLTGANTTFIYTPSTWTNGNVQVGISTTETGYTLQYSTDGNTWNNYTSAITVTNNQAIYARLWDGTNYGGVATGNVTNIDKSAPAVPTITYNGGANTNSWKNNYNITLSSSDNVGINYYEIDWDDDGVANTTTGANFIPWNGFGSSTTRFRAVDYAGNRSAWTGEQYVYMDTSAPGKTSVNLNGYTSGSVTSGNVTQTYSATDNVGVAQYQCSNDGGASWFNVPNPWVINWDGQWTLYIRAIDYAGNIGAPSDPYNVSRSSIKAQVGSFVNYTAGTWTQADINLLGSWYSGTTLPTSSNPYQFGGFGVGSSRDNSISSFNTGYNKYSSGWRVLDLNGDGSIKDIVHAGTSEEFYYSDKYVNYGVEVLTNQRNWSMYVNSAYATSAHCMTYNEAYAITGSEDGTNNDLRHTGSFYWLDTAYDLSHLWYIGGTGGISYFCNNCIGIRPVVTMKSGIQIVGGSGTQADPYQMR